MELVQELKGLAPEGVPLAQVALRWILDHPQVSTIIAGVSKPEQLADNVAASERGSLFPALMGRMGEWYEKEREAGDSRGGLGLVDIRPALSLESPGLPPSPLWGGIEGGGAELSVGLDIQFGDRQRPPPRPSPQGGGRRRAKTGKPGMSI